MKKLFAIACVFLLILSGCGNDNSLSSITDSFKSNTLTLFMPTPDTLDPIHTIQTSNMKIYDLIYDSLIYIDSDFKVVPQLSESCTVSADCKSIVFTLKSGVTWHDGTPFTSKDVEYTLSLLLSPYYEGPYAQNVSLISSLEVNDDLHFTIFLKRPYAPILSLLTFPIVPSHITNINENPCGTGQYKFSEYQIKSHLILTKNTLWQLGDIPIEATVRVNILDNIDDIASILNLGEISAETISAAEIPKTGIIDSMQQFRYSSFNYEFIGFNHSNPVFSDSSVRHGISAAINRESLLNDVYFGNGRITNCPIHPSAYFYNKEVDNSDYIKDKYLTILSENGWSVNANGIFSKAYDDESLYSINATLLVNDDNPLRVRLANLISKMLSECGMKISVEAVPFEDYYKRIEEGKFSMFIGGIDFSADFDLSNLLPSTLKESKINYLFYTSEKMDTVLSKIDVAVSTVDIKNAYLEFEYVFTNDLPCIGLFFTDNILLCSNRIEGAKTPSPTKPLAGINKWHFSNK